MARRCPYVCHASATIPPTICPRRRPSCTMVLWNVSTSRCTRRYPARDKTNTVTAKTTSTSLKVSFTVSTTHCSSILSKPSIFYNNIRVQVRYQAQSDAYRRSINTDSVAASPGLPFTVQGESWKVRWGSVGERQNAPFETAPDKGEALCRVTKAWHSATVRQNATQASRALAPLLRPRLPPGCGILPQPVPLPYSTSLSLSP